MAAEHHAWPAADVLVAYPGGPIAKAGYAWRGLGLFVAVPASPKGRRPAKWSLTHLGSGHAIAFLTGDVRTVFPVASEVAMAGDWTFDGLQGYKNQFPDAAERLSEIIARHPTVIVRSQGGAAHEGAAQAVATARAGA